MLLCSTYRPYITAHTSPKNCKLIFYLPCYCHICTSNIHAPQAPLVCVMYILLDMHQWGGMPTDVNSLAFTI